VVDIAGYFINPLVTVVLGCWCCERLRPAQWAAIGVGAVAVAG
jgi:chloramphenicol-sensitive protein RarD